MGHHDIGFTQVLAGLAVLMATVLLIISKSVIQAVEYDDVRWISLVYVILAMVSMAILTKNQSKYERQELGETRANDYAAIRPRDKLEHILDDFALPIGLVIFGSAGITLRMFYALSNFQCIGFFLQNNVSTHFGNITHPVEQDSFPLAMAMLINNMAVLIFFCIQLPFLYRFHTLKARRVNYRMHHLTLIVAGASFEVWFGTFWTDTLFSRNQSAQHGVIHYGRYPLNDTCTLEEACLKFSTAANVYSRNMLKFVLLPFNMKFMLASLEILLHVWLLPLSKTNTNQEPNGVNAGAAERNTQSPQDLNCTHSQKIHSLNQELQNPTEDDQEDMITSASNENAGRYGGASEDSERIQLCPDRTQESIHDFGGSTSRLALCFHQGLTVVCNFYTALIVGLLHATLIQFFVVNSNAKTFSQNHTTYMSNEYFKTTISLPIIMFRILFILAPLLLVSSYCAHILSKAKVDEAKVKSVTGNSVVLVLAIAGCVFLSSYRITVCVIKMQKVGVHYINFLDLIEAVLPVPQFIAQALVIYYGKTRKLENLNPLATSLHGLLNFLAVLNFILWITDSFSAYQFYALRRDLLPRPHYHNDDHHQIWTAFMELFLPPCIYFEYSCCVQILRVKRFLSESTWQREHNINKMQDDGEHTAPSQRVYGSIN